MHYLDIFNMHQGLEQNYDCVTFPRGAETKHVIKYLKTSKTLE